MIQQLVNRRLYLREITGKPEFKRTKSLYDKLSIKDVLLLIVIITILLYPSLTVAVPPGTIIDNMAVATYTQGIISDMELESNIVRVITVIWRTPSTTELLRYAPDNPGAEMVPLSTTYYSSSGTPTGQFIPMAPPVAIGQTDPIDLNQPAPLIQSDRLGIGEPAFIRLIDYDQNIDTLSVETILVQLRPEYRYIISRNHIGAINYRRQ
jgi:hypothetical protein